MPHLSQDLAEFAGALLQRLPSTFGESSRITIETVFDPRGDEESTVFRVVADLPMEMAFAAYEELLKMLASGGVAIPARAVVDFELASDSRSCRSAG